MGKEKKRTGRLKYILGGILLLIVTVLLVFHKPLIVTIRSVVGMITLESGDEGLTYTPQSLTKEQMLEDLDSLYEYTCTNSFVREEAEERLHLDYDALYTTYRSRIEDCEDEYEFLSILTSFMAKLPGSHNTMYPPSNDMNSANAFALGTELAFYGIRETNYAYWTQFEDRIWSYTQKGVVASHYGTDYVILDYDFGNGIIDEIVNGRIVTLNGKPITEMIQELDTVHPLEYDAQNDCARVTQIIFNDSIGERYEAEIEMPDGSIIKRDLYISPEFSLAMMYRENLYPNHNSVAENDTESTAETTTEDENTTPKRSYTITTDPERKLVFVELPSCRSSETEAIKEDLAAAITSIDTENIIIDLKSNKGGDSTFILEGVCPSILDNDAGWKNTEYYPRSDVSEQFIQNIIYSVLLSPHKKKDRIEMTDDNRVEGTAEKPYNIYVLTSNRTFSSGDICAGILAHEEGVTLIGENTGGEGFTGSPLTNYLPNSKFAYAFSASVSATCPDDSYIGTVPDIYCANDWESYLIMEDLEDSGIDSDAIGSYENRQLWDKPLNEALKIIDGDMN